MDSVRKKKKIGIALGGGGARGLAHIGVLRALRDFGIEPDYVAGTSMGSIVGGWYCAGEPLEDLEEIFRRAKEGGLLPKTKILSRRDGKLFKDFEIQESLEKRLSHMRIEKCKIPFAAVATNLKNGDEVVLDKGSINLALRASSAVPIAFKPVKTDDNLLLVDGAYSNPVPADVVKKMGADIVIAVDVSSRWTNLDQENKIFNTLSILEGSQQAIEYQLAKQHTKDADLILRPSVTHLSWLDFGSMDEIISAGFSEARANINKISRVSGKRLPTKTLFDKVVDFLLYRD